MTRTSRTVLINTLLVIGALLVAFPLLWMISVSFMPTGAASRADTR
jgi:ABC-type glycerol-3-phosphate transport system permease component